MKMKFAWLAAALALLLAGCQAGEPVGTGPVPPDTPAPAEESSPPESPSPAVSTPEELLARQPIDDEHDAFLVDTGGRLGALLVTVEKRERGPEPDPEWENWEYPIYLFVWDPEDMSKPLQELEATVWDTSFHRHEVVDANFDGYMDLTYLRSEGNGASSSSLWIWGEEAGQFVEVPEYREISLPRCNPETEIIDGWERYSGGGDGLTTFHRWEDGELVCVRRIETGYDRENQVYRDYEDTFVFATWIRVEDRLDGELTEVYYQYYAPDEGNGGFFPDQEKWRNLDYHGED